MFSLCSISNHRRYPYNIRRQNSGGGGHNALHSYHHHHHSNNNNNVGSSSSPAGATSSASGYSNHSAGNSPSSLGGHSSSSSNNSNAGATYGQGAAQSQNLPLSQHDELIRYIHEAWNKVKEQGPPVIYCNESDNQLKNFKPFDLEEYWGQRLIQNIHVTPTQAGGHQ
ncbi:hypothetical protein KR059_001166 [Drosophila kikkawai]|nr:hypothetical protein KR059_001166 [Drosophila kikkawai]